MIVEKKIMCLVIKDKYPRISFKDIKVKKVILVEGGIDNYKSPIQRFQIQKGQRILRPEEKTTLIQAFGGKYRNPVYVWQGDRDNLEHKLWKYSYGAGFIHSYHADYEERVSAIYNDDNVDPTQRYIIVDAIIPAGTPYYYDPKYKEYCSTKLILNWKN